MPERTYSEPEARERLSEIPGWSLDGSSLKREYHTSGWPSTMLLVNALAFIAELANHHPELEVGWSKVVVRLSTHSAGGITGKDFAVAKRFDETAFWRPPTGSGLEKLAQTLVFSSPRA
jgi:4a-hydroxytetrahydrobiopterin dehydratase